MARVIGTQGRPIQGISQQPNKNRIQGQCTESINFRPDIVKGLRTRTGSVWVSLLDTIEERDEVFHYRRDEVEEYFIVIPHAKAAPWVFDKNGVKHIVNTTQTAIDYLYSNQATFDVRNKIAHTTIADTTFLVNRDYKVLPSNSKSPIEKHQAVVYVQFMDYSQTQRVTLDGTVAASFLSPDGTAPEHKAAIATNVVANNLFNGLNTSSSSTYNFTLKDNCIFIERKDGTDFTLNVSDDAGGNNLFGIKDYVTSVSELPPKAPNNMVIQIRPKSGNEIEFYWLKSEQKDSDSLDVYWKESVAPDTVLGFNNLTMPVTLVRESFTNGQATFKLDHPTWGVREVGNASLNPDPSFVNSTIKSVGLFQNRLMFTSGETVTMSRSSEFFDFYKETTQTVLDTDPYEVYSDAENIVSLRDPLNFNGDLVFFTDTGQVVMSGQNIVTPSKPTPLQLASSFEVQPFGRPTSAGENIFFPFDYGQFSGIREYFVDSLTDTKRARPITDHVNQLIKGYIRHMASSTSLNTLAVQGSYERGTLYFYDWLWQGNEKVQSAWGKWQFPEGTDIRHFEFSGTELYMMYVINNTTHLVRFDLGDEPDNIDVTGEDLNFSIDHKKRLVATRNASGIFVLPNSDARKGISGNDVRLVQAGGYQDDIGVEVAFEEQADGSMNLIGDLAPVEENTIDILLGVKVEATYIPSNPYPKDQDGTATSGLNRLQIGRFFVNYDVAGVCKSVVKDNLNRLRELPLYPRIIGNGLNLIGFSPVSDGTFKIPVRAKSSEYQLTLSTESVIPLQIRELEFEANYSVRGRNI